MKPRHRVLLATLGTAIGLTIASVPVATADNGTIIVDTSINENGTIIVETGINTDGTIIVDT